jgi:hypothetical protein
VTNEKSPAKLLYVRDMLGELRKVADTENADLLCYFIEMAYIEAGDIISNVRPAQSGATQLGSTQTGPIQSGLDDKRHKSS